MYDRNGHFIFWSKQWPKTELNRSKTNLTISVRSGRTLTKKAVAVVHYLGPSFFVCDEKSALVPGAVLHIKILASEANAVTSSAAACSITARPNSSHWPLHNTLKRLANSLSFAYWRPRGRSKKKMYRTEGKYFVPDRTIRIIAGLKTLFVSTIFKRRGKMRSCDNERCREFRFFGIPIAVGNKFLGIDTR